MGEGNHYKVSYVVEGGSHAGAILNSAIQPQVGDRVCLDGAVFIITDVIVLIPAKDDFGFLHATVRYLYDVDAPR